MEQLEAQLKDNVEEGLRTQLASLTEELELAKSKAQEANSDAEQMRRAVETKSQELIKMVDDLAEKERLLKDADQKVCDDNQSSDCSGTAHSKHPICDGDQNLRQSRVPPIADVET